MLNQISRICLKRFRWRIIWENQFTQEIARFTQIDRAAGIKAE
jgi:hypothetical protein